MIHTPIYFFQIGPFIPSSMSVKYGFASNDISKRINFNKAILSEHIVNYNSKQFRVYSKVQLLDLL